MTTVLCRGLLKPPFLKEFQVFTAYREMEITFHTAYDEGGPHCWVARYMDDPNNICGVDCWEDVIEFHKRASKEWREQPLPPDRPWIAEWGNPIIGEGCCKHGPIEPPIGPCLGCGSMFSGHLDSYDLFSSDVLTFGANNGYVMCRYCLINNRAQPVGTERVFRDDPHWRIREGDYPPGHWTTFSEWISQVKKLVSFSYFIKLTAYDYLDFWSDRKTPKYVANLLTSSCSENDW